MSRNREDDWEPALGVDDEAGPVEVRVHRALDGANHAVVLPAAVRRLNEEQSEVVFDMQRRALAAQKIRDELDGLALEAREIGVSWAAIAWSLGLSTEAARKRWGDEQ